MNRKTSRRDMLKVGLGSLPVISIGGTVPAFLSKFAFAQPVPVGAALSAVPRQKPAVADDNILVVVQLSGGNDGLNTVVPVRDDAYYKARPVLGLKPRENKLHKLSDELYLNSGLTAFKEMFDEGHLAVINGCGYPQPNRSHFESMAIWHTADPVGGGTGNGWLGHWLDHQVRGTTNNFAAVNIGPELPQALVNDGAPVPSVRSVYDFDVKTDPATPFDRDLERQIISDLNAVRTASPALQFLSRQATNAIVSAQQIQKLTAGYKPDAEYPQGLGNELKLIAQIIAGNFGTKLFYCDIGGFDTHSNQAQTHEQLLAQVATSIKAFYRDLGAKGLADKVTVMCFSEFGRRIGQNSSNGTDHGTAGPMFVAGPKVKGGVYGEHPSLADTDGGDLKYTTDFRRVYTTLLERWLGTDPAAVLKNRFEPIAFL